MNQKIILILTILVYPIVVNGGEAELSKRIELNKVQSVTNAQVLIGTPGRTATYQYESGDDIPGSIVKTLKLAIGPLDEQNDKRYQWRLK